MSVIYSYVFFSTLLSMINIPIYGWGGLIFTLIILLFSYYSVVYVWVLPYMLNGTRIGNSTDNFDVNMVATSLHVAFWSLNVFFVVLFFGHIYLYDIYMAPFNYFLFTNIYIVNIIANFIGKKSIWDYTPSMILNSFYIGIYPFTSFGPDNWVGGYTKEWLIQYAIFQMILISILHFQYYYGSRFFLPSSMRKKTYENFLKTLSHNSPEFLNKENWGIWLNKLSEPELE